MDDKELPEWYQMLKEVFAELNVFSMGFYEDMNCANVLNQVRFAAIRDKSRIDIDELSHRAAELQRAPAEPEQPCPMCDGKGFNRDYGRPVWCEVCYGTGKSDRSGRG